MNLENEESIITARKRDLRVYDGGVCDGDGGDDGDQDALSSLTDLRRTNHEDRGSQFQARTSQSCKQKDAADSEAATRGRHQPASCREDVGGPVAEFSPGTATLVGLGVGLHRRLLCYTGA